MDKDLIIKRFTQSFHTYSDNAAVQRETAAELLSMIGKGPWTKVMEIGCGDGLLTRAFIKYADFGVMCVNDLCPSAELFIADLLSDKVRFIASDAEKMDFPVAEDLIISSSTIQWFDDLPAFFSKCADSLREGGTLAFSTFGPSNLKEIASLEGISLKYRTLQELKDMLSSDFDLSDCSERLAVMEFNSPSEVLRHLKKTGVKGLRREIWTKGHLSGFSKRYKELFSNAEGNVVLTYHPICIVAKKKRI